MLAAVTLVFIYPFIWLLSASFKPRGEVFDNKLIPETFTFDNYIAGLAGGAAGAVAGQHRCS